MIVINQGRVNYKYKISENTPEVYDTKLSNRVVTTIVDLSINVSKEADKFQAYLYDILTYTIIITNIKNEVIENVVLNDEIPEGTSFIKDSVKINGTVQYGSTPQNLYIGNLYPYEKIHVTFQVIILKEYKNQRNEINNISSICYDFKYNIIKDPIKICLLTNKVTTHVIYNIFKQISESISVKIHLRMGEKFKICKILTYPEILKCKIINTITGTKLLVIWEIKYLLNYLRYFVNYNYEICNDIYKEYFSTLIDIPCIDEYCNIDRLEIVNESCCYNYVEDYENIIICNTVLIAIK